MKKRTLNQWLWKWHVIAGLVSLPFVILLAITGSVYLFKPQVEHEVLTNLQEINEEEGKPLSYQKQLEIAKGYFKTSPNAMILPKIGESTTFVKGRFSRKKSVFIHPFTGEVTGAFSPKDTWMHTVRKLHGELLGGKVGTKIIELIASWMVVLILTGLYVWFPFKQNQKQGVFSIRLKEGKRTLYRDLHAVLGFWFSLVLLIVLAGGFPWTDLFGSNFKWVQKVTNTGYPDTWKGKGLISKNKTNAKPLSLDDMVFIAKVQNLEGEVSLGLPKLAKSTFSVSNKATNLDAQKMLHFNQYSGELVKGHVWSDVGVLMRSRMWLMAFHQGEFGLWNWIIMLVVAAGLTILSVGAVVSYLLRKPSDNWGIPKVPKSFKADKGIVVILLVLSVIFPLFGISLVAILLFDIWKKIKHRKQTL